MVPSLDNMNKPLKNGDVTRLKAVFQNLQGNILKGHGRDHTVHVFLAFGKDRNAAKDWVRQVAARVSSAQKQHEENMEYKNLGIPGSLFVAFFLSNEGYKALGRSTEKFAKEFQIGMSKRYIELNDPPKEEWEESYGRNVIHAMVLLADDDESYLLREARNLISEIKPIGTVTAVEHGRAMRNEQDDTVEHFGYVDGRSQPIFFADELEKEAEAEPGPVRWAPSAGPDLVIVRDPLGVDEAFGSYFVFRKLEQNVRGFKEREEALADELGLKGSASERAGALLIGRFEDGTPILFQQTEGRHDPVPNNFSYDEDRDALKCPFQAHIRKINPRGESEESLEKERRHRIARRGITYGEREKEPKDDPSIEECPTKDVGLLFMCYQRDIANQFEYIQRNFANDQNFVRKGVGLDPLIGQAGSKEKLVEQNWSSEWGAKPDKKSLFHGAITLKGGEYFFAPSISFLKNLR